MKKIILSLLSLFTSTIVQAVVWINATNFPDATFREYVSWNYDKDFNKVLNDEELAVATYIGIYNQGIKDLKGIEYFSSMKTLYCESNQLKSLNLSGCIALEELYCDDNQLTSLSVNGCTKLTKLYCGKNQLTWLNLSSNLALTGLGCSENQLTSLDISNNTLLNYLSCSNNQLTSLDLSKNSLLESIDCYDNQLTSLDVSACSALQSLSCDNNQLTTLNLSGFSALEYLYCRNNKLTSLDVSECPVLKRLLCNSNKLTSLDFSYDKSVFWIECYDNQIRGHSMTALVNSLRTVDKGYTGYLYAINNTNEQNMMTVTQVNNAKDKGWKTYCFDGSTWNEYAGIAPPSDGIEINKDNFPDAVFREYVSHTCDENEDDYLEAKEIENIKSISLNNMVIKELQGIEFFTALEVLDCSSNHLTSLDVSKNTALIKLYCHDNQIDYLDVSKNTALEVLACAENPLNMLDVSDNIALKTLYCYDNQLTSLDLSKNTALVFLSCFDNQLTSLDVSNNTVLTRMYCYNNLLNSFDISKNTALIELYCNSNQLTSLDVSKNTALQLLACDSNPLNSLDVSNNTALTTLYCYDNQLTSLDVSKNTALQLLSCFDNQLTSLDVSNNTVLKYMFLYHNQIKGESMDALVGSLAATEGIMYVIYGEDEGNIMTVAQVKAAESKGWIPYYYAGDYWLEYAGLEPGLEIDGTNFPDENFRSWLLSQSYGTDGVLTSSEIADIKSINISGKNIQSLKGIEFFTALTGLSCYENQLTSLDVSKNIYLTGLFCDGNQLISLDVSKNTELTKFECCDNQLTSLDVSNNPALKYLDCSNNKLTSLDVSKSTALEYLYCCYNQISGKNMDLLVNSLPVVNGDKEGCLVAIYDGSEGEEVNVITDRQVAVAKRKGWMSYSIDDNEDLHEYPGVQTYVPGDVNGDDIVNGTDIQAVINFIVASEYDEKADINEDGKVNGTDIQEIINIIVNAQ